MSGVEFIPIAIELTLKVDEILSYIRAGVRNSIHYGSGIEMARLRLELESTTFKSIRRILFGRDETQGSQILFRELAPSVQIDVLNVLRRFLESLSSKLVIINQVFHASQPEVEDVIDLSVPFGSYHIGNFVSRVRFGFSLKGKLEKTIRELEMWNVALRRIIQLHMIQREIIGTSTSHSAPSQTLKQIEDETHDFTFELKQLGLSSDFRLARYSSGVPCESGAPFIDLQIDSPVKYIRLSNERALDSSNRFLVTHNNTNFLIETRQFKKDKQGQPIPESVRRIEQLTSILHEASASRYRILHCKEFFLSTHNFNLVFTLPQDVALPPKSLFQELGREKACLDDRYILAREIALSIANFHAVGWVHKSIRSDNILLFTKTDKSAAASSSDRGVDITKPCLVGWDYARPATEGSSNIRLVDELNENIYRHPDQWGLPSIKFNQIHDLYALGILLYEIGIYRPIKSILRAGYEDWLPNQFRHFFVHNAKHARFNSMVSRRYQRIVVKCLTGEFEEANLSANTVGNRALGDSANRLRQTSNVSQTSSLETLTESVSLSFDSRDRPGGFQDISRSVSVT